jgi:hypothetical protein
MPQLAQRKKPPIRRNIQIAVYAPPPLYNLVVREAEKRRRKLGPTCEAILWEYFDDQVHRRERST